MFMRKIFHKKTDCRDGALSWFSRIKRLARILGVTVMVAALHHPCRGFAVTLPGQYSVSLAWNKSTSLSGTSYRLYYGGVSGNYTNSVLVGNVANNTVAGLAGGVTYFFATTACDAAGMESTFSNEISFTPGNPTLLIRILTNRQAVLTVSGLIAHTYQILASTNMTTWSVISTVTLGVGGSTNFTDTSAPSFAKRFYRTRDTTP